MHHEFAIDAVQDGLQVVPLPRILAVKQLQYPHDKSLHHKQEGCKPQRPQSHMSTVMRTSAAGGGLDCVVMHVL